MNNTLEIKIVGLTDEANEELIAFLSTQYYDAFEEEGEILKAYIKEEYFDENQLRDILAPYPVSFSKTIIEEKNWNEVWESNFSPVIVDDFCVIRAEFHPMFQAIEHVINITPKMSFGTGHHATTYLMIQQMSEIDFKGKKVADFGTGTGVLAILAEKMGGENIVAIDYDDWSIENSKENFQRNDCKNIKLEKADKFPSSDKFDIILANINKNVIQDNATNLSTSVKTNGHLLLSGLLKEDENAIVDTFITKGFYHQHTVEKNNWICILLKFGGGD